MLTSADVDINISGSLNHSTVTEQQRSSPVSRQRQVLFKTFHGIVYHPDILIFFSVLPSRKDISIDSSSLSTMAFLSAYTSLPGSLAHPLVMSILIMLWVVTWLLGIQARQRRLNPRATSETGLLSGIPSADRRHHKLSASLVFLTTAGCFSGMGNTYARTGRLFPGPHLWGGLAVLLAASANVSLVPWFKDIPRIRLLHATNGLLIILLLANQIMSGIPILVDVWRTVR